MNIKFNWRTTLLSVIQVFLWALFILAFMPYELGQLAEIINPEWKLTVVKISGVAYMLFILIRGSVMADAKVVNGLQEQVGSLKCKLRDAMADNDRIAKELNINQRSASRPNEEST
jgi:hypothetical protein